MEGSKIAPPKQYTSLSGLGAARSAHEKSPALARFPKGRDQAEG